MPNPYGPFRVATELPPVSELHRFLAYDPYTGVLWWRSREFATPAWNKRYANQPAGSDNGDGYLTLRLPGTKNIRVHRIAWAMYYGKWPETQIDHDDRDPKNNRIDNLSEATALENNANRRGFGRRLKGVKVSRSGQFEAKIVKSGRYHHLGTFTTEAAAHAAYCAAARAAYGDRACLESGNR